MLKKKTGEGSLHMNQVLKNNAINIIINFPGPTTFLRHTQDKIHDSFLIYHKKWWQNSFVTLLYVCRIITPLLPLLVLYPYLVYFLFFFVGLKGPPFGNAQRCNPLSTKHMKTEGSWKNMRNMRRDMRAGWRWRTFKEAALDMEHDDRLEIGRISHIHTP